MEDRTNRINRLIHEINGNLVPMFRWVNYHPMKYWYDEESDNILCDCGVSVRVDLIFEEITFGTILDKLHELEEKVIAFFEENHHIVLTYGDD